MTLNTSVADDQLGRYFRRMVAIADRADKSLPFEKLMDTLQTIHDGKLTPFAGGLRGRFVRTMPITIGGVSKEDLLDQVRLVRSVSPNAESMMKHEAFTTLDQQEAAILIDLSPADLGFTENPTTTELFDKKRLAEWSAANLDGYVIELCHAEVGPHFAIQYSKDQPKGEVLWVAMERIPGLGGYPFVFGVRRGGGGGLWLSYVWADPDDHWGLVRRIVFRLRKVSSASAV